MPSKPSKGLVLSRKAGQDVVITVEGTSLVVRVLSMQKGACRLLFSGDPKVYQIARAELLPEQEASP